MMRPLLFLCLLTTLFYGSEGLQCYVCAGSPQSDCAKNNTKAMGTQVCYKPKPKQEDSFDYQADSPDVVYEEEEGVPLVQRVKREIGGSLHSSPPPTPHTFDVHCVYMTTTKNKFGSPLVIRECAYVYHNQDICEFFKKRRKNVEDCSSCDDDLCNL